MSLDSWGLSLDSWALSMDSITYSTFVFPDPHRDSGALVSQSASLSSKSNAEQVTFNRGTVQLKQLLDGQRASPFNKKVRSFDKINLIRLFHKTPYLKYKIGTKRQTSGTPQVRSCWDSSTQSRPGLLVKGLNSQYKDCGFESQQHTLDGHFSHEFVVQIALMFV